MMPNRLACTSARLAAHAAKPSVSIKNALTGLPPPRAQLDRREIHPLWRLHRADPRFSCSPRMNARPRMGRLARRVGPTAEMIANGSRCARGRRGPP